MHVNGFLEVWVYWHPFAVIAQKQRATLWNYIR